MAQDNPCSTPTMRDLNQVFVQGKEHRTCMHRRRAILDTIYYKRRAFVSGGSMNVSHPEVCSQRRREARQAEMSSWNCSIPATTGQYSLETPKQQTMRIDVDAEQNAKHDISVDKEGTNGETERSFLFEQGYSVACGFTLPQQSIQGARIMISVRGKNTVRGKMQHSS